MRARVWVRARVGVGVGVRLRLRLGSPHRGLRRSRARCHAAAPRVVGCRAPGVRVRVRARVRVSVRAS